MEFDDYYENPNRRNIMDTPGPQRHCQDEGRARKCRGSRALVIITVCLGILCLLLITAVTLLHFQCSSKRGFLWGPDGLFMSNKPMSWSDSRHYCRDRGADLVIINTEEKQRHLTSLVKERVWIEIENEGIMKWVDDSPLKKGFIFSFVKERVWIGLSDTEKEGNMKWVDNSPLNQGFWLKGEPNDEHRNEDCIELMAGNPVLNNWNDLPCSEKKKGICETCSNRC